MLNENRELVEASSKELGDVIRSKDKTIETLRETLNKQHVAGGVLLIG